MTLLAFPGWIVLAISILWRIWYESQRDLANEFIDPGPFLIVPWFGVGVVLVALDKFRRKSESEQRLWRIVAIAYGLAAIGAALCVGTLLLSAILTGIVATSINLSDVELILDIRSGVFLIGGLSVLLFVVTSAIGLPAYTLYLTYRALRSWWTYLRTD